MSQLKDILEFERNRMESGPFNVIYLFPESSASCARRGELFLV